MLPVLADFWVSGFMAIEAIIRGVALATGEGRVQWRHVSEAVCLFMAGYTCSCGMTGLADAVLPGSDEIAQAPLWLKHLAPYPCHAGQVIGGG